MSEREMTVTESLLVEINRLRAENEQLRAEVAGFKGARNAARRRAEAAEAKVAAITAAAGHRVCVIWQERPGEVSWRCLCGFTSKHQRLGFGRVVAVPECAALSSPEPASEGPEEVPPEWVATCRHCGHTGYERDDHTCPCPYSDAECPNHPAADVTPPDPAFEAALTETRAEYREALDRLADGEGEP